MLIKELYLREGLYCRNFNFTNNTLIYSKQNSQGKTTLIRLILHSFGFNVPSNVGINFFDIETKLLLNIDNENIKITRLGNNLYYEKKDISITFYLPKDRTKLHSIIFGLSEIHLIENLLGAMYIDQTKGNVVLNRGDIIGNINFSVEKFIAGLQGTEIDELTSLINIEQKSLKDYKSMQAIAEYKNNNNLDFIKVEEIHYQNDREYNNELNVLKAKLKLIKMKIKDIQDSLLENKSFINIIESYKLYVTNTDGHEIPVNSKTINGFSDNGDLLDMQLKLLHIDQKKLERKIIELKKLNQKDTELIDGGNYKDLINEEIKKINIDYSTITKIVNQSDNNLKSLKKQRSNKVKYNSEVVSYINEEMFDCAFKLGVSHLVEKKGIFTSMIQNKSGANFYKIVISFKIAFLKGIEKYKNIKVPFIIDSLRNSELTQENAYTILELIKEKLPDYQLIIASVFEYGNHMESKIIIEDRLINNMLD